MIMGTVSLAGLLSSGNSGKQGAENSNTGSPEKIQSNQQIDYPKSGRSLIAGEQLRLARETALRPFDQSEFVTVESINPRELKGRKPDLFVRLAGAEIDPGDQMAGGIPVSCTILPTAADITERVNLPDHRWPNRTYILEPKIDPVVSSPYST